MEGNTESMLKEINQLYEKLNDCFFYMKKNFEKEDKTVYLNYYYHANKFFCDIFSLVGNYEDVADTIEKERKTDELYLKLCDSINFLNINFNLNTMLSNIVTIPKYNSYYKIVNSRDDEKEKKLWDSLKPFNEEQADDIFRKVSDISICLFSWEKKYKERMKGE